MGGGRHGGFGRTRGAVAGDANFMGPNQEFLRNIRMRKDVDPDGKFDVIAHGAVNSIIVEYAGKEVEIDSRTAANLNARQSGYKKGQPIRLLSCNTGSDPAGFAQNLANKLNVIVYAPNDYLWSWHDGHYEVAAALPHKGSSGILLRDSSKLGKFVKFIPGGNKL